MKENILTFILVFAFTLAIAQENKKYIVKAGTRPSDTFTYSDIYLYPAFQSGKVYFKSSKPGSGMMNYNRYTDEIDFMSGRDTLALADKDLVKYITIAKDTFYYQKSIGYIQHLDENSTSKFAKKDYLFLENRKRPTSTTGSYNNNSLITPGANVHAGTPSQANGALANFTMVENVELIYVRKTDFYFSNAKGSFLLANEKNVLKLYPDKKAPLSAYIQDHAVDFKDEASLRQLFTAIPEMK